MTTPDALKSLIDMLKSRISELPTWADNEAWRREFLVNPILTEPSALAYHPSEIGAEISYPVSDAEFARLFQRFGTLKKRIRPDYVIVPADQRLVGAVVEAKKRHSSLESHLRHSTQVIVEQMISGAAWGILTDGERWTLFRGDDTVLHLDSLDELLQGMTDFRHLVGAQSIRDQLIHKPTLTVLMLSDKSQVSSQTSEVFNRLRSSFPALEADDFHIISQASVEYNSFAAAGGDRKRWWYPDVSQMCYWPSGATRSDSLSAFVEAYTSIGYQECPHHAREISFERIAFFGKKDGSPRHAAYQLSNGLWASKLGRDVEIVHPLRAIEGDLFGRPIMFMRRPINNDS